MRPSRVDARQLRLAGGSRPSQFCAFVEASQTNERLKSARLRIRLIFARIALPFVGVVPVPAVMARSAVTGSIPGIVSDTTGAVIPRAMVKVANTAQGLLMTSVCIAKGVPE